MSNQSKRLIKLFLADPHCHWCGKEVIYVRYQWGKRAKPNWATIDHLRSRLNPARGSDNLEATVLSCWQCNQDRNRAEQLNVPMRELWERSKSFPQGEI